MIVSLWILLLSMMCIPHRGKCRREHDRRIEAEASAIVSGNILKRATTRTSSIRSRRVYLEATGDCKIIRTRNDSDSNDTHVYRLFGIIALRISHASLDRSRQALLQRRPRPCVAILTVNAELYRHYRRRITNSRTLRRTFLDLLRKALRIDFRRGTVQSSR